MISIFDKLKLLKNIWNFKKLNIKLLRIFIHFIDFNKLPSVNPFLRFSLL